MSLKDLFLDIADRFKYEVLQEPIETVDTGFLKRNYQIKFTISTEGVYGGILELPGAIFTADKLEELPDVIFDTLLVYHDVPRYQSLRLSNPYSISLEDGKVILNQDHNQYNYA